MKKIDLKKIAMLSITGGIMIASQSAVQAGHGGCGNKGGCGGYTAPSSPSGCGGRTQPSGYITENETPNRSMTTNDPYMRSSTSTDTSHNYANPNDPHPATRTNSDWGTQDRTNTWDNSKAQTPSTGTSSGRYLSEAEATGTTSSQGETQLLNQLNEEGKAIFRGLDPEGKLLAIKLAAQTGDKNAAVRSAAEQMAQKRAMKPNTTNSGSRW